MFSLESLLRDISAELRSYGICSPPVGALLHLLSRILKDLPGGVTRHVLLAEMESRWRQSMTHIPVEGGLREALKTRVLVGHTTLCGYISKLDNTGCRFLLEDEGAKVEIIMHGQVGDWLAYTAYKGADMFSRSERRCRLSHCRLTKISGGVSSESILIPTELISFELNAHIDEVLLRDSLLPLHSEFMNSCIASSRGPSVCPSNMCGVFAFPLMVSGVLTYPAQRTARASQYRLVALRLVSTETVIHHMHLRCSSRTSSRGTPKEVVQHMILVLYDDQVGLPSLWKKGELLYFHRPLVCRNVDESSLFGSNEQFVYGGPSFTHLERNSMSTPEVLAMATAVGDPGVEHRSQRADIWAGPAGFHFCYAAATLVSVVTVGTKFDRGIKSFDNVPHNVPLCCGAAPMDELRKVEAALDISRENPSSCTLDVSRSERLVHRPNLVKGVVNATILCRVLRVETIREKGTSRSNDCASLVTGHRVWGTESGGIVRIDWDAELWSNQDIDTLLPGHVLLIQGLACRGILSSSKSSSPDTRAQGEENTHHNIDFGAGDWNNEDVPFSGPVPNCWVGPGSNGIDISDSNVFMGGTIADWNTLNHQQSLVNMSRLASFATSGDIITPRSPQEILTECLLTAKHGLFCAPTCGSIVVGKGIFEPIPTSLLSDLVLSEPIQTASSGSDWAYLKPINSNENKKSASSSTVGMTSSGLLCLLREAVALTPRLANDPIVCVLSRIDDIRPQRHTATVSIQPIFRVETIGPFHHL